MRRCVTIIMFVGLAATVSTSSAAAATAVPPGGKVGGKDYARWLVISWKALLAKPAGDNECDTVRGVRMLFSTARGPRTVFDCSMRAGAALYVNLPSVECSNVEKPPYHGDTATELKTCAREQYEGFFGKVRLVIDGKPVRRLGRWITKTGVFRFRMPKKNVLGTKKRRGKAAAYGAGVFIKGLKPGRHVLKQTVIGGGEKATVIQRITVTG
jgi:hypothetical protein